VTGQLHAMAILPFGERKPGNRPSVGWVGPRAYLEIWGKRKSLASAGV